MNSHENEHTGIAECKNLYEQYYTMVYRLSLLLLKNTQDAEDAAQTIFLKVMEKQPAFADEDHTRAWLLTVTRNHCYDVKRSFWHKKRTDMEHLPEPSVDPFDRQESLLFDIFQPLPGKQREVVYLYYFEDYSLKEIDHILERIFYHKGCCLDPLSGLYTGVWRHGSRCRFRWQNSHCHS